MLPSTGREDCLVPEDDIKKAVRSFTHRSMPRSQPGRKIVHVASFENLPENLLLIKIEIPGSIEIRTVPEDILVADWDDFPFSSETVDFGTSLQIKF
jgi:hypothetical protein